MVLGAAELLADAWLDQEDNALLADALFQVGKEGERGGGKEGGRGGEWQVTKATHDLREPSRSPIPLSILSDLFLPFC